MSLRQMWRLSERAGAPALTVEHGQVEPPDDLTDGEHPVLLAKASRDEQTPQVRQRAREQLGERSVARIEQRAERQVEVGERSKAELVECAEPEAPNLA